MESLFKNKLIIVFQIKSTKHMKYSFFLFDKKDENQEVKFYKCL
jgi:hypothetical protein